jgi:hypothetical protein
MAEALLGHAPFTDVYGTGGVFWCDRPVYPGPGNRCADLYDRPPNGKDIFEGPGMLCLEVPDELFRRFNVINVRRTKALNGPAFIPPAKLDGLAFIPLARLEGLAFIPAAELNRLDSPPQLYDYWYAGISRHDLVRNIREWGEGPARDTLRAALQFLDRVGWTTPLRLREEAGSDPRQLEFPLDDFDLFG